MKLLLQQLHCDYLTRLLLYLFLKFICVSAIGYFDKENKACRPKSQDRVLSIDLGEYCSLECAMDSFEQVDDTEVGDVAV